MTPTRKRLTVLGAASVGSAALFALLASDRTGVSRESIDALITGEAAFARSPLGARLLEGLTYLGWTPVLVVLSTVMGAYLLWRRSFRPAVPVVVSPVAAMLAADSLKDYFARVRPIGIDMAGRSYSFPSGHTTGITAVAITVTYVLIRERIMGLRGIALAVSLALLVGASRLYLGQHHASDVVAGWLVGTAVGCLCCLLYEVLLGARPSPTDTSP